MTSPDVTPDPTLQEAARELKSAVHDAQVAFDCIGLGNIDRAHTSAITARTAIDAAMVALQTALAQTHQAPVLRDPPAPPGPQTPLR